MARYRFAAARVSGRVLDVACGTGFGLPVLAEAATRVVGVDREADAVRASRRASAGWPATVVCGDGCRLPFGDGAFDAITSFETLEHLTDRAAFLAELRRVLSPTGCCVLSTPNALWTQPVDGVPANPHHVHEYTPAELLSELSVCFPAVTMLGQMLDERYTIPPFWDAQARLPRRPGVRSQLMLWRAVNKLPVSLREGISRLIWQRPFYPTETAYRFDAAVTARARVLVAVCWPVAAREIG